MRKMKVFLLDFLKNNKFLVFCGFRNLGDDLFVNID